MVGAGTLKSRTRIGNLFKESSKFIRYPVTILIRKNGEENNMFLYCVHREVKTAVLRNRLRRILKESVRLFWNLKFPDGYDICLMVRLELLKMNFSERKEFFSRLFHDLSQWVQK